MHSSVLRRILCVKSHKDASYGRLLWTAMEGVLIVGLKIYVLGSLRAVHGNNHCGMKLSTLRSFEISITDSLILVGSLGTTLISDCMVDHDRLCLAPSNTSARVHRTILWRLALLHNKLV
jgi:hypothetical protein